MEKKTVEPEYKPRAQAMKLDYAKIQELLLQNVKHAKSKTFTQYTKDLIKQYGRNPYSKIENIRKNAAYLS